LIYSYGLTHVITQTLFLILKPNIFNSKRKRHREKNDRVCNSTPFFIGEKYFTNPPYTVTFHNSFSSSWDMAIIILLLLAWTGSSSWLLCLDAVEAFGGVSLPSGQNRYIAGQQRRYFHSNKNSLVLFSKADETTSEQETKSDDVKLLGAATSPSTGNISDPSETLETTSPPIEDAKTSSQTTFMITREMKRTLVEGLGYTRKDVERIKVALVPEILQKRIRSPTPMPTDWIDKELEMLLRNDNAPETSNMMKKLEEEGKYPLKFPLLGISLVLFGKGFSDALITIIKVNMDFPGASLTASFQGIPVLAIDVLCVIAGLGLGLWTYNTMK